jgi:transcription-repair coupling factor (superfamily II helicase)
MTDRYGEPPEPVANLVAVARFRLRAKAYGLTDVSLQGRHVRFAPLPLPDSKQLRLKRYHPDAVFKPAAEQVSVPRPATRRVGGELLRDQALLEWCGQLLSDVMGDPVPVAAAGA